MKTIDLNKLIESKNLDVKELAKQLFPSAKYPKLALDRILNGSSFLDSNQISILSMVTQIPIGLLYENGNWESIKGEQNILKFATNEYVAELNTETWMTKIYKDGSIFHEEIIHNGSIPLSEYLSLLTDLIIKHK